MSETALAPPAPRRAHHAPLSQIKTLQEGFEHPEFKARIKDAVPKHMQPDRMLSTFILAVRKTPKLMKVDPLSFLGACIGLSTVGLEPNTPLGHAYLIPFEETKWNSQTRTRELIRVNVQVIFGYQGLLDLVHRAGTVRSVHADVVWAREAADKQCWDYHYGTGAKLLHRPLGGERGEDEMPVWAYMHAAMKGEAENFEVMPIADVLKIRNDSQAYRGALAARDTAIEKKWKLPATWTEAPWVKHFVPMARKTVFRAGQKWLPKSIELASTLAWDELQDRRNVNYGAIIDGEADVLDGGLSALEDETGIPEMDMGMPPREEREPARNRREPAPPAVKTTHQVKLPDWIGYLADEQGEMVGDTAFTEPLAFAEALHKLWKEADDKPGVLAANLDTLADAKKASNNARAVIEDMERLTPRPGIPKDDLLQNSASQPAGPAPVPIPQDRRGAAWPLYVRTIKTALQTVGKAEFGAWMALNVPSIQSAPDVHRLTIAKYLGEHCAALGLPQPSELLTRPAETEPPPADRDKQWTDDLVLDLVDAPTIASLDGFLAGAVVISQRKRLAAERPELAQAIDNAERDRRAQLAEPPLDPDPDEGFPGDKYKEDLRR